MAEKELERCLLHNIEFDPEEGCPYCEEDELKLEMESNKKIRKQKKQKLFKKITDSL